MKRILITGGTGFVGYWMQQTQPTGLEYVRYLNKHGYGHSRWFGEQWDYIVHLAPIDPYTVLYYSVTRRPSVRILYASSGAVYNRETEYANNKRRWERECNQHWGLLGTDVVVARLFTFFGEHLDKDKAISRFIEAAQKGQPIHIWGDGSTVRSYMHGREMGKWLWAILLKGKSGEAYDVGSDVPMTMLELARQVVLNVRRVPIILEDRPDDCPYYMPLNTAKTRRLLDEGS